MGLVAEQVRTAMTSPEQLKRWLEKSGRRWLVFDALELVDALEWPLEVEDLQRLITAYREHRQTIPTAIAEQQTNPATGEREAVTVYKTDELETSEKIQLVRDLCKELVTAGSGPGMEALDQLLEEIGK